MYSEISTIIINNIALIFRIILDILIICFSLIKVNKRQNSLEKTYNTTDSIIGDNDKILLKHFDIEENKISGKSLSIISFEEITISFFRLRLLLSTVNHEYSPGVYIEIKGKGLFNEIHLSLPMIVLSRGGEIDNIKYYKNDKSDGIVLKDERSHEQINEIFHIKIYFSVILPFSQSNSNLRISIPLSAGPFYSGQPYSESRTASFPLEKSNKLIHLYYPKIEKMEISISDLRKNYFLDPFGQMPEPEYYSADECRWISGINMRQHSSVICQIHHKLGDEQLQIKRIRGGIVIGIWTAVLVTVIIDCLWSLVELSALIWNLVWKIST